MWWSPYYNHKWRVFIFNLIFLGVGWDQGVVPAELQPRGTQASFNEAGNLVIDSQASSINVTALVGKKAILGCVVRNINNHSVSITQSKDIQCSIENLPAFLSQLDYVMCVQGDSYWF